MNLPYHASGERDYITMRTMTVVRKYLAASFLLVIGLIAYGCGDSATVNPEATLANLTVSTGAADATLDPVFNPETRDYTVNLSNNVTTVTITAQPAVAGDTVTIDGQTTPSTSIALGQPVPTESTKTVRIDVANPPSSTRTYTVSLKRAGLDGNNSLRSLAVSPGTPPIAFEKDTRNYTVSVLNSVDRVTVTPTLDDPAATMTVNGQPATSGQARTITPLNPPGQSTTITILVRAQNGTEKPYTITVSRGVSNNNNLQGLTISLRASNPTLNQTLEPRFSPGTTGYTVNLPATLPSDVTNVRVTPTLDDTTATMTVNGEGATSGQGKATPLPAPGRNTTINIIVIAQNGTPKTYSVNVIRDALGGNNNLRSLTVSQPGLSPTFRADRTAYTLNVGASIGSITVNAAPEDPNATLTVTSNGQVTTSGQARTITLRDAGLSTTINIVVRAPSGSQKPYTITVDRAAPPPPSGNNNLQNLTVSPGTLSPAYSVTRTRTDYAVNDVSSSATTILVTATPQDPSASVTINDQGGNSRSIPLPGGPSRTEIEVRVIAPSGNDKTYLITVIQPAPAAPPTPTVAPDLIREDDSCPSGIPPDECAPDFDGNPTSREDNVTTVTTPRFSIPQPGAGETATLYINGNKDESSSTTGNLLRPSTSLSDGTYTITYTLSNSGGESGPSPVMTPPLRIITTPPPPPSG